MRLAIIDLDEIEAQIEKYKKIKAREINPEEKAIWGAFIDGYREVISLTKPLEKLDELRDNQG